MSRIGKQPVPIPDKVKVEVKGQKVFVEGPKGKLDFELPRRTAATIDKGNVLISRQGDDNGFFRREVVEKCSGGNVGLAGDITGGRGFKPACPKLLGSGGDDPLAGVFFLGCRDPHEPLLKVSTLIL